MHKSSNPVFDMHSEFSYKESPYKRGTADNVRAPLPSIGNILVTLLGFFGGVLVLIYIGVTH